MSNILHPFEDYIYQQFATALRNWQSPSPADVYALSLVVNFNDDDVKQGQIFLCYNTEQYFQQQQLKASNPLEARWSLDYWPQDYKSVIANSTEVDNFDADNEGVALRDQWQAMLPDVAEQDPTIALSALCVWVIRRLHYGEPHLVEATFGRPIPVIIHEPDCDSGTAERTRLANPPGLASDFEDWVISDYGGDYTTDIEI